MRFAEDLVQTTLAKTYVSWGRVRDVDAGHRYARTALFNTAASWFRRPAWRREVPTDSLPEGQYTEDTAARPTVIAARLLLGESVVHLGEGAV